MKKTIIIFKSIDYYWLSIFRINNWFWFCNANKKYKKMIVWGIFAASEMYRISHPYKLFDCSSHAFDFQLCFLCYVYLFCCCYCTTCVLFNFILFILLFLLLLQNKYIKALGDVWEFLCTFFNLKLVKENQLFYVRFFSYLIVRFEIMFS